MDGRPSGGRVVDLDNDVRQANGHDDTLTERSQALATVLARLIGEKNLSKRALAERAGTSASTIVTLIRGSDDRGNPNRPSPDLLRGVARGLATDKHGDINPDDVRAHYWELMSAVGYLRSEDLPANFSADLATSGHSRRFAALVLGLLATLPGLSPTTEKTILRVVELAAKAEKFDAENGNDQAST